MDNQDQVLDSGILQSTYETEELKIMSLNKFIFLCIITLGLYHIWWTYKAWRFFKQKEKSDIFPAARAFFSIFFLYSLFERIRNYSFEKGYDQSYSSGALFIGFIVASILSRLPEPYGMISVFAFLFSIPPFKALNYAKLNSPELLVTEENSYSGRQIALVVVGIIMWGLVIAGYAIMDANGGYDQY